MTNNLTLIESEVLNELLEKAFLYDILSERGNLMFDINLPDFMNINKQIKIKKEQFLSNYVDIPLVDLDGTIEEGLKKLEHK